MEEEKILELVNNQTFYMIDVDGVCIDTEQRLMQLSYAPLFHNSLRTMDWKQHIYRSKQVRGSLDILREIQGKLHRIALLTQNCCREEEECKIDFFRKEKIDLPIISVPPGYRKSSVVPPCFFNGNVVLVDDRIYNVNNWIEDGGIGVLFTDNPQVEALKVKTLEFLKKVI